MSLTRKRKHASVETETVPRAQVQLDLKAFANVRKPSIFYDGLKKRKTTAENGDLQSQPTTLVLSIDKKRKRSVEPEEKGVCDGRKLPASAHVKTGKHAVLADRLSPTRKKAKEATAPTETPSKSTMAMFDKLKIEAIPCALKRLKPTHDSVPDALPADEATDELERWPSELEDLKRLNVALLSALSMYYAHNGASSSVPVKDLLAMTTKSWGKRSVTLDDLRMLAGFEAETESGITLQDFGSAGVCLVRETPRGRAANRAVGYVDEVELNARFETALRKRWMSWCDITPTENQDARTFIDQQPRASITKSNVVEKAAPLFARGQQRLTDLKASQAASNAEVRNSATLATETKAATSLQTRGAKLLDRILAKQAQASSAPAGLTKEQSQRRAALYRVEDVFRVLDLLSAGRPRCSFSMQATTQRIQQSLRNPISREEVAECLEVLAGEIAPGFVGLVKSLGVTGVVVTRGGKVGGEELRRRVESALA